MNWAVFAPLFCKITFEVFMKSFVFDYENVRNVFECGKIAKFN